MERLSRVVGPAATNVHLMADPATREAIAIDAATPSLAWIVDELAERGWTLKLIVSTHGHWDHIGDNAAVAAHTGADIAVHPLDRDRLEHPAAGLGAVRDPAVGAGRRAGRRRHDPVRGDPAPGPAHAGAHRGLRLPARRGRRASSTAATRSSPRAGAGSTCRVATPGRWSSRSRGSPPSRTPSPRCPGTGPRRPSVASAPGWSSSATVGGCLPDPRAGMQGTGRAGRR